MNAKSLTIAALIIIGGAIVYFNFLKPNNRNHMMQTAGSALVTVNIPQLSGQAATGEKAFNKNCATCHGTNAAGQEGVAPPLIHKIYEPSHHGDQSFVLAAKNGVRQHHWPFGNMPPVDGITDTEIADIIAYIRTVQRANGIN